MNAMEEHYNNSLVQYAATKSLTAYLSAPCLKEITSRNDKVSKGGEGLKLQTSWGWGGGLCSVWGQGQSEQSRKLSGNMFSLVLGVFLHQIFFTLKAFGISSLFWY